MTRTESRRRGAHGRLSSALALLSLGALALAACSPTEPPATQEVTVSPSVSASALPEPSPEEPSPEPSPSVEPVLDAGAVSSGHPAATAAGVEVLTEGGNAVDAAIATAFAVTVAEPFGSGLGGGGSAILVAPGMDPVNVDYRDVVPASGVPADSTGVPGFVAGLWHLHQQYGTLPWARLVEPAIELAREGVPVSSMLHDQIRMSYGAGATRPLEHFYPGGKPLAEGDLLVQKDLAKALERVAEGGAEEFYRGRTAKRLEKAHPALDAKSLASYAVQVSEPPSGEWAGYTVYGATPALPGPGFIQLLQIVEALEVTRTEPGSAQYVNLLSTALRRALRTMKQEIGDPAFVDVESARLTDREENERIARGLDLRGPSPSPSASPSPKKTKSPKPSPSPKKTKSPKPSPSPKKTKSPKPSPSPKKTKTPKPSPSPTPSPSPSPTPSPDPSPELPPEDEEKTEPGETTHLTVVDSSGFMVSMTNTLTSLWGSRKYVDGFFLNDQLNRFQKIAGPKNTPEPGRRTVSWSLPNVVVDGEGRPVLGIGSPAGERIPMILGNVMTLWGLYGFELQDAVDAPRFHAAGRALDMERKPGTEGLKALQQMGYKVTAPIPRNLYFYGSVQAIEVDWESKKVSGAQDSRRTASFALSRVGE